MERTRKLFARAASAFVAAAMALSLGAFAFAEETPAAPEESAPQQTVQAATPGEAPAEPQAAAPARLASPAPKAESLITVVRPTEPRPAMTRWTRRPMLRRTARPFC